MGLKLPTLSLLSREQDKVLNLSYEKNYIVEGGPGSGKSVLALLRLKAASANKKVGLLVYNKTLQGYLASAVKELGIQGQVTIETYDSWIFKYFRKRLRSEPPMGPRQGNSRTGFRPILWLEALTALRNKGFSQEFDYLILDEAQDFPVQLCEILKNCSRNFMIFIDQNQAIGRGITIDQAMQAFGLTLNEHYKLTYNYRNTKEIYDFVKKYSPPERVQEIVPKKLKGRKPMIICDASFDDFMKRALNYHTNNIDREFGCILWKWDAAEKMHKDLDTLKRLSGQGQLNIQTHISANNQQRIDFSKTGLKIVYFNVMKGLEFETVFIYLPGINFDDRELKMKYYVAMTRAAEELYIITNDGKDKVSKLIASDLADFDSSKE